MKGEAGQEDSVQVIKGFICYDQEFGDHPRGFEKTLQDFKCGESKMRNMKF